ncbi:MAG: undecaprenyl-phosphate glucose phosphotransferase [Bacteroidota bacterium]
MQHRFSRYIRIILFIGDLLILNLCFLLTSVLLEHNVAWTVMAAANLSWAALVLFINPYRISRVFRVSRILVEALNSSLLYFLLLSTTFFFISGFYLSKVYILNYFMFQLLLLLGWRIVFFYLLRIYRISGFNYRNVVIVGYGEISKQLESFFRAHPEHGYRLLGIFDDMREEAKVIGKCKDLAPYLENEDVDEIYCCMPYIKYGTIKNIIDLSEERLIKVKLLADFRAFSFKGIELERYDYIPVLNVSSIPLDNRRNQIFKRSFDILFSSLVILCIFSWLFPILAIIIKLDSRGPVFFKQKRTGVNNTHFWCWKFRTMYVNGDSDKKQATKGDSRITTVGSFLRKTSLDELPQFFNVLEGSMSVVGPRPHMLKHTEEYSRIIAKFMARHFVKPGITGLAQAKGYRGETQNIIEMKNRVKLDRFYIENWSFIFDLKIVMATVVSMLKGDEKAY